MENHRDGSEQPAHTARRATGRHLRGDRRPLRPRPPRYVAENTRWGRHPDWPAPVAKRGRSAEFDPQAVHAFVQQHHTRQAPALDPNRAYTVTEAAKLIGLTADTIYSDISRGRWPDPDTTTPDGIRLWHGSTLTRALQQRRKNS